MKSVVIQKPKSDLASELSFPGDKSLSHRAIIFGALAEGESHFTNVLSGEDCVCTRKAFESMGVRIKSKNDSEIWIEGRGLYSLKAPSSELYLGNSGTSMRLLMGLLAGQSFSATLTGDSSLSSRPMRRVTEPLRKMGAKIHGKEDGNLAPLVVEGSKLKGIRYALPIASAQLKSAILLAGLYAEGVTEISEPEKSRDHTERFLKYFGGEISEYQLSVSIKPGQKMLARDFEIAGDISSAAFFMAIAALFPSSNIYFRSVLWNPTRTGIVDVMKRMGITFEIYKQYFQGPEPVADFSVKAGKFQKFEIKKKELPLLIDEIPILMVLATQAEGTSVIHEADELRVKETDRIKSMTDLLARMGADIRVEGNTVFVKGPTKLRGAEVDSLKDHRTAMSGVVASMVAEGKGSIRDVECINTSFPSFFNLLGKIGVQSDFV